MISTYTIIAGNMRCPNNCPICISKMTPSHGIGHEDIEFNWVKFRKATRIAVMRGAQNVLITGKGEPTLFPGLVEKILTELASEDFERIELQTEGSNISKNIDDDVLRRWRAWGLDLIAISIYDYKDDQNGKGFGHTGATYGLGRLIKRLRELGFLVRLSCVLRSGFIDSVARVQALIGFCKVYKVFQLTLRTADVPQNPLDLKVAKYVTENELDHATLVTISDYFMPTHGIFCYTLPHGVPVYEVDGQNVSITTGLGESGDNRQLIFFPQGWLTMSWETVQGSRII